jgi:hypothetical protein
MTRWFLAALTLALPAAAQAQEAAPGGGGEPAGGGAESAGGGTAAQASLDTGAKPEAPAGEEADEGIPGALVLGAEVGGVFPQPFTGLDSHVLVGIELGYRLPFASQRIEIMTALAYTPPHNSYSVNRPNDGTYNAKLLEQELFWSLGPRVRFMPRSSPWNVSLAAGFRWFFLRSVSNGSKAGQSFAEFKEESSQGGFFIALGGEYNLGPGALFLDIDLGYSSLPHKITGDASTGNIAATLGYRFFLL